MSVNYQQVTVDDTGAKLADADHGPVSVHVHIEGSGSTSVFLGDADVTESTGFVLEPGDNPAPIRIRQGDALHAIAASGNSATVYVLEA